jgi:hypothetical protein
VAVALHEFQLNNNFDFNRIFKRSEMPPLAQYALLWVGRIANA